MLWQIEYPHAHLNCSHIYPHPSIPTQTMATSAITAYGGIRTVTVSTEITVTSTPVTIMLNWPSPPISQSIQYTSLASPNDLASSKYFLRPIPLFVLTEIDGVVVDTGGMPITTVTKLQSVPTDVYFATGNIDGAAAVADCSGNEWACWNAGKKVGVVIGSVFAFLFSVLIILCYCCAMRRRRHELSDGEIEMGDRRGSSSPAPNVVSQFSKRRPKDSKSAPRTGYPRPVRVKKPWIIPLPDVKDTSRGLTWPQGAGLMDNISNFRTQRRGGFISGRNCQVYREDPFRLSREPIIQATGRRAANSSRRDPLRAPRDGVPRECAIQGAGRDFERQTEQRDRVYRSRRGVSIHDPYRNSSTRGQVQQAPFSKRKLLSTDVSPSLDSTSIGGRR
jgi:hypothetical protein